MIEKIQDNFLKTLKKEFSFTLDKIISFSSNEIKIKTILYNVVVYFYINKKGFDYDFDTSNTAIYNKIYNFYSMNIKLLRYIFKEYQKELFNKGL